MVRLCFSKVSVIKFLPPQIQQSPNQGNPIMRVYVVYMSVYVVPASQTVTQH